MNNGNNRGKIDWKKCERALKVWQIYKDDIKTLERIVRRKIK